MAEQAPESWRVSNATVAAILHRVGDLLEAQGANRYRIRAYHRAAETVRRLSRPVRLVLAEGGQEALVALPNVGERLAASIDEILGTGSLRLLERLEGQMAPEDVLAAIPGIGEELAHRIHEHLEVETLEDLEVAAFDGRLESIDGIGTERVQAVKNYLEHVLNRSSRGRARARRMSRLDIGPSMDFDHDAHLLPEVKLLLQLDERYRDLAERDRLPRIAPTRFNPEHHKWLPVWHPERDGFSFTVLFSNSATAHRLGKTHDWVVIYFESDGQEEQCTVVTEFKGALSGRRVIRGREAECAEFYEHQEVPDSVKEWAHEQAEKLGE